MSISERKKKCAKITKKAIKNNVIYYGKVMTYQNINTKKKKISYSGEQMVCAASII